jgi:hypothetical protein
MQNQAPLAPYGALRFAPIATKVGDSGKDSKQP